MTTLQETILGGAIAGLIVAGIVYLGKQVDKHYIQKKIESTPDFWSTLWYYMFMFLTCLLPTITIIYYYQYKPLDKFFVFIVALCIGVIVFIALNSIHTRQVIKARREAINHTNDLVLKAFRQFGDGLRGGPPPPPKKEEPKQPGK